MKAQYSLFNKSFANSCIKNKPVYLNGNNSDTKNYRLVLYNDIERMAHYRVPVPQQEFHELFNKLFLKAKSTLNHQQGITDAFEVYKLQRQLNNLVTISQSGRGFINPNKLEGIYCLVNKLQGLQGDILLERFKY